MLNSCASNVVVVNIDAGFNGGHVAGLIARRAGLARLSQSSAPEERAVVASEANTGRVGGCAHRRLIADTPEARSVPADVVGTDRISPSLPPRAADGHKGRYGTVLVIAGGRGMAGAAALCGASALRSGAGLVRVASPAEVQPTVASFEPSYMTYPAPR